METGTTSPLVGTIPEEHIRHREQFWDFVLSKAEPEYREPLTRLLAVWEDANARYYGGALARPIILLATPCEPGTYGDCGPVSGFGCRSQIRLRRSLLDGTHPHMRGGDTYAEGRFRFVADVLMHEQIHQWQQEITGKHEASYHGHGPGFCAKCNEMGQALGLRPVIVKARPKHPDGPRCPQWPHCVRPVDYYCGAYVPTSGDRQANLGELAQRLRRQLDDEQVRELVRLLAEEVAP